VGIVLAVTNKGKTNKKKNVHNLGRGLCGKTAEKGGASPITPKTKEGRRDIPFAIFQKREKKPGFRGVERMWERGKNKSPLETLCGGKGPSSMVEMERERRLLALYACNKRGTHGTQGGSLSWPQRERKEYSNQNWKELLQDKEKKRNTIEAEVVCLWGGFGCSWPPSKREKHLESRTKGRVSF